MGPRVPVETPRSPLLRWWPRWRSMKAPRKLKFTREGKFFVGITLGVGFAAINTGNNLLYLLLGMLLALIVVSVGMFPPPAMYWLTTSPAVVDRLVTQVDPLVRFPVSASW